jgi:hypothetical protein
MKVELVTDPAIAELLRGQLTQSEAREAFERPRVP